MGAPRFKSRKDTRQSIRFRYFASFVLDTDPAADATRMPETDRIIGIDLGLTHFAVLSDGTKIDSPRFLRRAEKKLKKAQKELSRKQKGSKNRAKACLKVARAHAEVADARREFHHQLSTKLISAARSWPGPCTTPDGHRSSACWSTKRNGTAAPWSRSAGSHRPPRPAPPAAST
ncbi:hypothetical protein SSP24_52890 [Streptomyces spinoverrucosus]|uniref:Probable transposase IS891/IS1136/IS1341 domain-containing protein n=1 Tax=Streptomyces spinoverrucosus TaxID=284043 RepID=A0A4Y3VL37_9ACTN|nr:hypothetical protein SSP24_52890 [Streptomyces spinoverrucosus]GHB62023.1 hypothetical protein GCM10010397_35130 [Streptomyces spinoverrucosus]